MIGSWIRGRGRCFSSNVVDEAAAAVEKLTSRGYRYPPFVREMTSKGMSQPALHTQRPTSKE